MNTIYPNITFASESERNDPFSFIDVTITRSNNHLVASVSRKAIFGGVFTNFKSFLPVTYKYSLVHRALSLCSYFQLCY